MYIFSRCLNTNERYKRWDNMRTKKTHKRVNQQYLEVGRTASEIKIFMYKLEWVHRNHEYVPEHSKTFQKTDLKISP